MKCCECGAWMNWFCDYYCGIFVSWYVCPVCGNDTRNYQYTASTHIESEDKE